MFPWFSSRFPVTLLASCPPLFVCLPTPSVRAQSPAPATASSPAPHSVEALRRKAEGIVIPSVDFRETTLADAIEFLRQKARFAEPDPEAEDRGVNLFVKLPSPADDGPAAATPAASPARITLNLRNASLLDVLRRLADSQGLEVTVERFAVCLEARGSVGDNAPGQVKYADGENATTAAAIMRKLVRIRIPTLETRRATLGDILEYLHGESVRIDGDEPDAASKGVEILLPRPAAGSGRKTATAKDLRLTTTLNGIPLLFMLHYVAVLADMDVEISPKAVTLVPHG